MAALSYPAPGEQLRMGDGGSRLVFLVLLVSAVLGYSLSLHCSFRSETTFTSDTLGVLSKHHTMPFWLW